MPKLACHACGRQVYAVAPLEALLAGERRCPRCGAVLETERRTVDRRLRERRVNPPHSPGPPPGFGERRAGERRRIPRRDGDRGLARP